MSLVKPPSSKSSGWSAENYKLHRRESNREAKRRSRARQKTKLETLHSEYQRLKKETNALREEARWANAHSIADFRSQFANSIRRVLSTYTSPDLDVVASRCIDALQYVTSEESRAVAKMLQDIPHVLNSVGDVVASVHVLQCLLQVLEKTDKDEERRGMGWIGGNAHVLAAVSTALETMGLNPVQADALAEMVRSNMQHMNNLTQLARRVSDFVCELGAVSKQFDQYATNHIHTTHEFMNRVLRPSQRVGLCSLLYGINDRVLYEQCMGKHVADVILQLPVPSLLKEPEAEDRKWRQDSGLPLLFSHLHLPNSYLSTDEENAPIPDMSASAITNTIVQGEVERLHVSSPGGSESPSSPPLMNVAVKRKEPPLTTMTADVVAIEPAKKRKVSKLTKATNQTGATHVGGGGASHQQQQLVYSSSLPGMTDAGMSYVSSGLPYPQMQHHQQQQQQQQQHHMPPTHMAYTPSQQTPLAHTEQQLYALNPAVALSGLQQQHHSVSSFKQQPYSLTPPAMISQQQQRGGGTNNNNYVPSSITNGGGRTSPLPFSSGGISNYPGGGGGGGGGAESLRAYSSDPVGSERSHDAGQYQYPSSLKDHMIYPQVYMPYGGGAPPPTSSSLAQPKLYYDDPVRYSLEYSNSPQQQGGYSRDRGDPRLYPTTPLPGHPSSSYPSPVQGKELDPRFLSPTQQQQQGGNSSMIVTSATQQQHMRAAEEARHYGLVQQQREPSADNISGTYGRPQEEQKHHTAFIYPQQYHPIERRTDASAMPQPQSQSQPQQNYTNSTTIYGNAIGNTAQQQQDPSPLQNATYPDQFLPSLPLSTPLPSYNSSTITRDAQQQAQCTDPNYGGSQTGVPPESLVPSIQTPTTPDRIEFSNNNIITSSSESIVTSVASAMSDESSSINNPVSGVFPASQPAALPSSIVLADGSAGVAPGGKNGVPPRGKDWEALLSICNPPEQKPA